MIAALALCECVPIGSLTRPERNQGVGTGQFGSLPHTLMAIFSVLLPAVYFIWSCDYANQVTV